MLLFTGFLTTGATRGGTDYPSEAHELTHIFSGIRVARSV